MSEQQNQATIVSLYDIDDLNAHHCGYCNENGNISIGMSSELMQIQDYQLLIDRGWRRSGTYLYKPLMEKTCCPLYTIKCDSTSFKLKRSQKNVCKNMFKFLKKNELKPELKVKKNSESEKAATSNEAKKKPQPITNKETNASKVIKYILATKDIKTDQSPNEILSIPKLKSKHKRLFRKLASLKSKNQIKEIKDVEKCLKRHNNLQEDSLESYLKLPENTKNKLTVRSVRSWPPSKEFQDTLNEEHEIYIRYQTNIHKDSPIECNMRQFQRFLCTSPLLHLSYKDGPLTQADKIDITNKELDEEIIRDLKSLGYGSFHQQYRLNDKLIAVGVIDILNKCVSSVYFFYDPEYSFLNLGTYSALREIAFTRQLNKLDANLKWYYLGFYAHSCRKMRYKGQFHPSFLLCPEVHSWHPIEYCFELLDTKMYSRFAEANATDSESFNKISDITIRAKFRDSEPQIFKFNEFCRFLNASFVPQFTHLITGYCKLFGSEFSKRVLIKF